MAKPVQVKALGTDFLNCVILKWILRHQSRCGAINLKTYYDRAMYQYCLLSDFHLAIKSHVICTKRVFPKRQTYLNDEIRGDLIAIFKVTHGLLEFPMSSTFAHPTLKEIDRHDHDAVRAVANSRSPFGLSHFVTNCRLRL